jgi:Sulfotransferase domain
MRLLKRIKRRIFKIGSVLLKKKKKPNKNAIWVFGMQKSGTTAIAGLLSYRSGLSVTLDTEMLWNPYFKDILEGRLDFIKHINANPDDFSNQIIKEPSASQLINFIEDYFNLEKYIFIYRDPHDVIRSILNRLDIPGDKINIDIDSVDVNWRYIFGDGTNYIEKLANLWLKVYSQDDYIYNSNALFVNYDIFKKDKIKFIDNLCSELQLPKKNDISDIINKDFQPRGNSNVDLKLFFGEHNFQVILSICDEKKRSLEQCFV